MNCTHNIIGGLLAKKPAFTNLWRNGFELQYLGLLCRGLYIISASFDSLIYSVCTNKLPYRFNPVSDAQDELVLFSHAVHKLHGNET